MGTLPLNQMRPISPVLWKCARNSAFYSFITATKRGPDIAAYVRFTFFRRELWLFRSRVGRGRRLFLILGFTLVNNPHLGTESFVVGVLDDFANVYVIGAKVENIVGTGIRGEPVLAVNL